MEGDLTWKVNPQKTLSKDNYLSLGFLIDKVWKKFLECLLFESTKGYGEDKIKSKSLSML